MTDELYYKDDGFDLHHGIIIFEGSISAGLWIVKEVDKE